MKLKNKEILKIKVAESDRKTINYRVTEKCNYKCPYCWFPNRLPINLEADFSAISKVQQNLRYVVDYYIKQGQKVDLFLTGGEPSLYPLNFYDNLFKLIEEKKIDKLTLSTNFSADPKWFKDFSKKCRGKVFFVIKAAFHPSECKINEYIEKIKEVKDCADKFIAHFTFDDNNFIGIDEINKIKALGVNLDVVAIHSKRNQDCGKYKISNPDLIDLVAESKKESKIYTICYKDGSTEEITLSDIKNMDFSRLKPVCHHTNITIMSNKIGINCEYMRSVQKIVFVNCMDISIDRTQKELYDYLKNKCSIVCDKKMIEQGNNCKPAVLEFSQDSLLKKLSKLILK